MQNNTVETLIGTIVVLIAAGFLYFAYTTTSAGSISGYELVAKLARVDGLSTGTDVRLSGLKIGSVSGMDLNPDYRVTVHMTVHKDVKIPDDSSVLVTSSGLLGGSYLSISPGGSDRNLPPGGEIVHTQGSVDVMSLVGRFMGGGSGGGSNSTPSNGGTPHP